MNNEELIREALCYDLGSDLHEAWRHQRKLDMGKYEPLLKQSKDEEWNVKNRTDEADMANLTFENLPFNCQDEYLETASIALDLVFNKIMNGNFNPNELDNMATIIHEEWLKRNDWVFDADYGEPELAVPFAKLYKAEKEKKRAPLITAIKKVEDYKKGNINIEKICEKYNLTSKTKTR